MKEQRYKNPIPTVDTIIQKDSQILLVKRKKEAFKGLFALPGGFVNEGERVEDAAKREAKEETSLDIELVDILGVYSEPNRDPRGHIMSTVFVGKIISPNNKVEASCISINPTLDIGCNPSLYRPATDSVFLCYIFKSSTFSFLEYSQ
jgi:8-oxo-dGTP diphosphatase